MLALSASRSRWATRCAAVCMLVFPISASAQSTATLYAVTPTNRLLTFSSANPSVILRNVPVTKKKVQSC